MRLILSSNGPWCGTGYGAQAKHLLRICRDAGFPTACVAFWGLQGGQIDWEGIHIYGAGLDGYGNDVVPFAIKDFKADVVFTLIDLWVMDINTGRHGAQWWPLFPIDSYPVAEQIAARFPHTQGLIVYSQFAKKAVEELGYKPIYIPHIVDCSIYRPCTPQEKLEFRHKYFPEWPEDAYIVGMVAANKGFPCRKSFPEVMEAFSIFAKEHDNARLYLHSYPFPHFGGPNLQEMAKCFGLEGKMRTVNPQLFLMGGYSDEMMRELYGTMDVLVNPAQGEGFCVPIVEAEACGIPIITTDFSAQAEVAGVGWRVPPLRMFKTLLWNSMAEADVNGIAHAMNESYRKFDDAKWQSMARDFALQYDIPVVRDKYWKPFLQMLDAGRSELAYDLKQPPES